MGRRLIITHGERTTQHELGERALVIGRDPGCDIFFIDQKLSRRHARVEPGPDGVELIDLGSRNGTWVNEQQVEQYLLRPGDQVRVGGLRIAYQEDPPPAPVAESTAILDAPPRPHGSSGPPGEDERTVMLGGSFEKTDVSPESTLMLGGPAVEPPPEFGTLPFKPGMVPESGTQLYKPPSSDALDATRIAPALATTGVMEAQKIEMPPAEQQSQAAPAPRRLDAVRQRAGTSSWQARLGLGLAAVGTLAYLVASLPLVNRLRTGIEAESIERGRTLLRFLAAVNEPVLADKHLQDLTTDVVTGEPGVKDALILDPNGKVLAPAIRSTEAHETLPGIDKKLSEIHSDASGLTADGDLNFVQPLVEKGRRIGFAVLTYTPSRSGGSLAEALFVGLLVIAAGAYGAVLLIKKQMLRPIVTLRNDVDAVAHGHAPFIDPSRPLKELSDLAESINKLHETAPRPGAIGLAAVLAETASQDAFPGARPERTRQATPPPQAEPLKSSSPFAGSTPPAGESEIIIDENFVVASAHPTALTILDSTLAEVEGRHLIEAIREQKLLELLLDLVNGLASHPSTAGRCELDDSGAVSAKAERRGDAIVVTLARV